MEENSSFEYEKKNGYVVITALKGDPSVVEIPGMLDGLPVTELKEYLFFRKKSGDFVPSGYCKKDWKIWIL